MRRRQGIPAGAFMASFSSAGRIAAPKLTPEPPEQAAIAARLAIGLPILSAEKSREHRDAIDVRRLAASGRMKENN